MGIYILLFTLNIKQLSKWKQKLRWKMVVKIQFHFPIRLFFKAEKMLIIDIYLNESLSSMFTFSPPADTLLWPLFCFTLLSLLHSPLPSSPSPETHLHNALLPLPLFPNIFLQLSRAPLSVTGVFSCSPHSSSLFLFSCAMGCWRWPFPRGCFTSSYLGQRAERSLIPYGASVSDNPGQDNGTLEANLI